MHPRVYLRVVYASLCTSQGGVCLPMYLRVWYTRVYASLMYLRVGYTSVYASLLASWWVYLRICLPTSHGGYTLPVCLPIYPFHCWPVIPVPKALSALKPLRTVRLCPF